MSRCPEALTTWWRPMAPMGQSLGEKKISDCFPGVFHGKIRGTIVGKTRRSEESRGTLDSKWRFSAKSQGNAGNAGNASGRAFSIGFLGKRGNISKKWWLVINGNKKWGKIGGTTKPRNVSVFIAGKINELNGGRGICLLPILEGQYSDQSLIILNMWICECW